MVEDNKKLVHVLVREYLRNAKLTGGLQRIGFDVTDYRLALMEEVVQLLGKKKLTNKMCDLIDVYEENAISLNFYDFPDNLCSLADELILKLKECN